jgi:signal transduction histidine kinase
MALTISPTLSEDAYQEKVLFVRVITMVGIVATGTLLVGWERARRREAVAAERSRSEENLELQRKTQEAELAALEERSRIAREIHDGVAQSIYMLSL